jgi:hypothetical protein
MMLPIIFLMLIVVSLSQKIFFLSSTSDTPRIGAKRQIGSRNPGNNAKRQVWNTILKREITAVGHIHVCLDVAAYQ